MLKKIDLTKKMKTWKELEYLLIDKTQTHPGARMFVILATTKGNNAQAINAFIRDVAQMCANAKIKGHVSSHTLHFDNGTIVHVAGYPNARTVCRGHVADFVFLPQGALEEYQDTILPMFIMSHQPYLYEF